MGSNGRSGFAYDGFAVDPKWPGLDAGDGIEVHHPTVNNLIKALQDDVDKLKGNQAGTVQHLRVHGTITTAHVGQWDAAQQLGTVFSQGHTSVTTSYEKLIAHYEATIVAIKAALTNIGEADEASDVGSPTST